MVFGRLTNLLCLIVADSFVTVRTLLGIDVVGVPWLPRFLPAYRKLLRSLMWTVIFTLNAWKYWSWTRQCNLQLMTVLNVKTRCTHDLRTFRFTVALICSKVVYTFNCPHYIAHSGTSHHFYTTSIAANKGCNCVLIATCTCEAQAAFSISRD